MSERRPATLFGHGCAAHLDGCHTLYSTPRPRGHWLCHRLDLAARLRHLLGGAVAADGLWGEATATEQAGSACRHGKGHGPVGSTAASTKGARSVPGWPLLGNAAPPAERPFGPDRWAARRVQSFCGNLLPPVAAAPRGRRRSRIGDDRTSCLRRWLLPSGPDAGSDVDYDSGTVHHAAVHHAAVHNAAVHHTSAD